MSAEEGNDRPHEKGCDHSADSHRGMQGEADDNTDYIGGDAKILELEPGVGVQVQGDDIVGGHAQICCEIQSGSQADENDTRHKKDAFQSEAGMGEESVPDPSGELGYIAQEKEVDKGAQTDLCPVHEEHGGQQDQIQDHIKGAKAYGGQIPHTVGKDLEGIHAEIREVEHAHGDTVQGDPADSHQDTSCLFVFHHFISPLRLNRQYRKCFCQDSPTAWFEAACPVIGLPHLTYRVYTI